MCLTEPLGRCKESADIKISGDKSPASYQKMVAL